MDIPSAVSLKRNGPLRDFVVFGATTIVLLLTDLFVAIFVPQHSFRLATTYLLPLFAAAGLWLLARVNRIAGPAGPKAAVWFGVAFVAGAAGLDLLSTILVNPDLSLEGNPYVRALLDGGHSLTAVYAHLAVTQGLCVLLLCGLWLTFLRQLPVLLGSIEESRPAGRLEFLKAATGGSHLTLRQWLVPVRVSELPMLYHCLWPLLISIIFAVSLLRCYAALEWMDLFEPDVVRRGLVLTFGLTASLAVYFAALRRLLDIRTAGD